MKYISINLFYRIIYDVPNVSGCHMKFVSILLKYICFNKIYIYIYYLFVQISKTNPIFLVLSFPNEQYLKHYFQMPYLTYYPIYAFRDASECNHSHQFI